MFVENWFSDEAQQVIAELVEEAPAGLLLEVGAWEGRSTVALANAAHPRVLHTVDTWAGADSDSTGQLAAERDIYAAWAANVSELTAGNVVAHRQDWRDFFAELDEDVAFCFIDAEHTYDEVADNLHALLEHLAPGAIICGDDIPIEAVADAVSDVLGEYESVDRVWIWRAT